MNDLSVQKCLGIGFVIPCISVCKKNISKMCCQVLFIYFEYEI